MWSRRDGVLALLRADGRAPVGRLAGETGVSYSTVQRRITELRDTGVLHFDVDSERARLGLPLRTLLWLTVTPARIEATGTALAAHPEVASAAAITGSRNVYASVATPGIAGLHARPTGTLATLRDVQGPESSLVLHTVKGPPGIRVPEPAMRTTGGRGGDEWAAVRFRQPKRSIRIRSTGWPASTSSREACSAKAFEPHT